MKKLGNNLYRITSVVTQRMDIIECDNEEELVRYILALETAGVIITNVVHLNIYSDAVRTPKVAYKQMPLYKELKKSYK